jgi:hypothetical protein
MDISEILSRCCDGYDPKTKTYFTIREAGLYAVLTWSVRKISLMELWGHKIDNINMILHEYMRKVNAYELLFNKQNFELSLTDLPETDKIKFSADTESTHLGYQENLNELNFEITNQIIKKYFTPNQEVFDWYQNFVNHLGGKIEDIIFIWARSTDKRDETKIPEFKSYLDILSKIDTRNKKILVQTDDDLVLQDFKQSGLNFHTLPQIPFSRKSGKAFHISLNEMSDPVFKHTYGLSKIDYLRQMLALSLIGKNAYKTILYPGNPTTYIPLMKGSIKDCFLFKDNVNLI